MKVYDSLPEKADAPIALTIGNFDGVHCGHQSMITALMSAAREREILASVLTFEPHPRTLYSATPLLRLTSLREKLALLETLGVDRVYVCPFDAHFASISAEAFVSNVLVRQLGVKFILIGDDFKFGARRSGDVKLLQSMGEALGIEVESFALVRSHGQRISSTTIRNALAEGDIAKMVAMLGRSHVYS